MRELKMKKGTTWLKESEYNQDDQVNIYEQTLIDVFENASYYLDSLDYIPEYRVYFGSYSRSDCRGGITHIPKDYKIQRINLKKESFINKTQPI